MSWACPAVRAVPGAGPTAMGADGSPRTRPDGTGIGRARAAEERAVAEAAGERIETGAWGQRTGLSSRGEIAYT